MLSGYTKSPQELIDIVNGCLLNKVGVLDLFSMRNFLSIYMDHGYVLGFFVEDVKDLEERATNSEALLLFYMADFLNSPSTFFSFRDRAKSDIFVNLSRQIHVEELILQAQLASLELTSLLERIITPYAVLKVQQPFPEMNFFDGKSVYEIIATSKNSFIDTIRKLNSLISKGFLDIHQFYHPPNQKSEPHVSVIIQGVEANKIKLVSIMENLVLGRFSGFLRINVNGDSVYIYYIKGKPIALHPINYPIFDFLIDVRGDAKVSAVELDERTTKLLTLRHFGNRVISGITDNFLELGKILMGVNIECKSGIITIRSSGEENYILYESGKVIGFLKKGKEGIVEIISDLDIKHPYWIDVTFLDNVENMDKVVYLSLINIVYGILLRSGNEHIINSVKNYIAGSENFKYEEGQIKYRSLPQNTHDIVAFLSFLLDMSYRILGEKNLEEELHQSLQPYKDVFNVFGVQDHTKSFVEGYQL